MNENCPPSHCTPPGKLYANPIPEQCVKKESSLLLVEKRVNGLSLFIHSFIHSFFAPLNRHH